jgi:type IV pilus assembly protein PilM
LKPLIALDIGSRNLHIVVGNNQKGTLKITRAGCYPLPESLVRGSHMQNIEEIAQVLAGGLSDLGAKGNRAVVTINASDALTKDIYLPVEKKVKKLDSMVTNELRLNYNVQDFYAIQYKAIEKDDKENNAMLSAFRTVSIDEALIGTCREILVKAKLKPMAMDVNLNAVDKLLEGGTSINGVPLNSGATMLIDFGHHETTAYIYSQGKPLFFRHISNGSGEIEKVLSEETFIELESMRENKEGGMDLFSEDEKAQRYFALLRAFFYNINDELRNIIKFYNNRYKDVKVDMIYLFGEGSRLKGLSGYWESSFNIPVEIVKSISSVDFKVSGIDPIGYVNCLGALIRY